MLNGKYAIVWLHVMIKYKREQVRIYHITKSSSLSKMKHMVLLLSRKVKLYSIFTCWMPFTLVPKIDAATTWTQPVYKFSTCKRNPAFCVSELVMGPVNCGDYSGTTSKFNFVCKFIAIAADVQFKKGFVFITRFIFLHWCIIWPLMIHVFNHYTKLIIVFDQ